MVDPEVGDEVPDEHVVPAEVVSEVEEGSGGKGDTDVADDDIGGLLVVEDGGGGVEVVDTTAETVVAALATSLALALVVVVAGDVGEEVVGPADELLAEEHEEGVGGSLLGQLSQLVGHASEAVGLLLAGAGHEDHVTLDVAGGLVVLGVGVLPAEVGDEQGGVEDPAGEVVDEVGLGEGAVAALVGDDPEAGAEEALEDGVDGPETGAERGGGDVLRGDEVVEEVEGGGEAGHVSEDVGVALQGGALEAVLGDGIADVLDGEVGDGEVVAVRVGQTAIVLLGDGGILGGERGQ